MKKRCAGTAVVLLLLFVVHTSLANPSLDFIGVLDPNNKGVVIDSVTVVPPDTTFQTAGWQGQGVKHDTFAFAELPQWPTDLWIYGTVIGRPTEIHIGGLVRERWYAFGPGTVVPFVMFSTHYAVEESEQAVEPRQRLTVSPSVVTGQMTVRLQPAAMSRPVVQIHDAVGDVVRSLDCKAASDGAATATWSREDEFGRLVPEGVYFCRYAGAGVVAVRKVLVAH